VHSLHARTTVVLPPVQMEEPSGASSVRYLRAAGFKKQGWMDARESAAALALTLFGVDDDRGVSIGLQGLDSLGLSPPKPA
jgi:hypothetical protein